MLKRVVAKARRMFSPVNRVGGRSFVDVDDASEQQLFVRCETLDEFAGYLRSNWDTHRARLQLERDLVLPSFAGFWITGFCAVCGSDRRFFVDFACARDSDLSTRVPNWRELLNCESCKLPNRARALLDFINTVLLTPRTAAIYLTEQTTPLFRAVESRYPHAVGSEFLRDGTHPGSEIEKASCTRISPRSPSVMKHSTSSVPPTSWSTLPTIKQPSPNAFDALRPAEVW